MGTSRITIFIQSGRSSPETWEQAASEEAPIHGKARACHDCPLRVGGEWEEGASTAIAEMPEAGRSKMKRWGCHDDDRPCAGMQRLLKAAP